MSEKKDTIRLQTFIARCGVASRRSAEKLIAEGRVSVNGKAVSELGTKVSLSDSVYVDGKQIVLEDKKRYVLLNKPIGYVCSLSDEKGRPVAADLLKEHFKERLYNVGRLDMFSSGLLIFTNDGDFAAKLSHPSAEVEKEYVVDTSLAIPRSFSEEFKKGLRVDGVFYRCVDARQVNARRMQIILTEGKNREIRRVFESMEIGIKQLTRVRIGNLLLEGLKPGEFRELKPSEIKNLLSLCRR
ncbi:rRNA pseudouridine synthase [Treponema parvum]|uniref:Pseudouridine synthase n=1 Tax=Treponema parvum TaxID=138851 RepID=A0A975F4I9_9SPIR|nr:pseudouridine synthase [Treponema parvum]QTQ14494.1 rRNA pseudouridine synthase [Treponema parvum]